MPDLAEQGLKLPVHELLMQVPAEAKISGLLCSLGLIRLQRDISPGVRQTNNHFMPKQRTIRGCLNLKEDFDSTCFWLLPDSQSIQTECTDDSQKSTRACCCCCQMCYKQ